MEVDVKENVLKLEVDDGDILLVTMPDDNLPVHLFELRAGKVREEFEDVVRGKDVRVVVMPHGMKVEYIPASVIAGE